MTTKHEINIPGLPEGYRAVAYRCPRNYEKFYHDGRVTCAGSDMAEEFLIVEKIKPRSIKVEDTGEIRQPKEGKRKNNMPKQTIEIDVPDGYELYFDPSYGRSGTASITVRFKKREPEFIEVREYLHKGSNGHVIHNSIQRNLNQEVSDIEASTHFIRWIDEDWRKVEI